MMDFELDGAYVTIKFRFENKVTMCYLDITDIRNGRTFEYAGYALCSSKDHYIKETGRKVALRRALELSGVDKPHRRAIWLKYHSRNEMPDDVAYLLGFVPEAEYLNNLQEVRELAEIRNQQAAYQLEMDFLHG
jgi:hypothetical protein